MGQAREDHAHPGAQRAYAREDMDGLDDLCAEFLHNFHNYWVECEEQIEALQNQKKAMLANVRSRHGRHQAEAIRITMRLMATDPTKRAEQAVFNDMARRYADVLETEIETRQHEH